MPAAEENNKEETVMQKKENMVTIRLPKTRADQEDVFVSVNDASYLIQRGVEVQVPASVAEVLRHREQMLEKIMLFEAQKANG